MKEFVEGFVAMALKEPLADELALNRAVASKVEILEKTMKEKGVPGW